MAYGLMNAGRLSLREDAALDVSVHDAGVALKTSGQESYGRLNLEQLRRRADDIVALTGQMIPVTFTQKTHLNGFYWVDEASGKYEEWQPEAVAIMPWSLGLTRIGYSSDTDLESRLSGPLTRANDHAVVGERWHAPSIGHTAYAAGASIPTVVLRSSVEGMMTVYRNVSAGVHPRWAVEPTDYGAGRVRFVDELGHERQAARAPFAPMGWTVHNGLVRLSVDLPTGALDVAAWTGGAWRTKLWDIYYGTGPATAMGAPSRLSVLRNDYESVSVRLTKALNPGRISVDLTLRRGSRFVEVFIQHQFGTTLALRRRTAEAATASVGYLAATADDADGNRYVVGSSRSHTTNVVQGEISKAATPVLDAVVGVQVGGAAAGDLAADLFKQYLGTPSEFVQGVRR